MPFDGYGKMNLVHNTIRIIAGDYRRLRLSFPNVSGLRPTSDRVRETVFNWLSSRIVGADCLDLFAGSGAMGFEAVSRGARQLVLVDHLPLVVQSLQQNQQRLAVPRVQILCAEAMAYLKNTREQFDIIFLDPPYDKESLLNEALANAAPCLAAQGLVYLEAAHWPALSNGWQVYRQARAGKVHYGLVHLS